MLGEDLEPLDLSCTPGRPRSGDRSSGRSGFEGRGPLKQLKGGAQTRSTLSDHLASEPSLYLGGLSLLPLPKPKMPDTHFQLTSRRRLACDLRSVSHTLVSTHPSSRL